MALRHTATKSAGPLGRKAVNAVAETLAMIFLRCDAFARFPSVSIRGYPRYRLGDGHYGEGLPEIVAVKVADSFMYQDFFVEVLDILRVFI